MDTVKRTGGKAPILAQLLTLALLILPALVAGALEFPATARIIQVLVVVIALLALLVCWPFAGPGIPADPDRGICVLLGLISLALAFLLPRPAGLDRFRGDGSDLDAVWPLTRLWLESSAVLLTILAVFMFARQMARKNRRMVIRGISATALSGLAVICASGWVFLPAFCSLFAKAAASAPLPAILTLVVGLVLLLGLVLAGWQWGRDLAGGLADESGKTGRSGRTDQVTSADQVGSSDRTGGPAWFGMALVPVMLSGALVMLAITALHFLV